MSDVHSSVESPGGRVAPVGTVRAASAVLSVIAMVAVVGLLVAWTVGRGDGRDGDPRLYETEWSVESATVGGEAVDTTAARWQFRWLMCDSDPTCTETASIVVTDGCGYWSSNVDLDESSGRWTQATWRTTADVWCYGDILDAMWALTGARAFAYTVASGEVWLASDDDRAHVVLRSLDGSRSADG